MRLHEIMNATYWAHCLQETTHADEVSQEEEGEKNEYQYQTYWMFFPTIYNKNFKCVM